MDDQLLQDWRARLGTDADEEATIFKEMVDLATIIHVFGEIREMIQANPDLQQHSAFYNVFGLNYAHSVLMYIRRQVRTDGNSLRRLLQDIRDSHQEVTREWFVAMYVDGSTGDLKEVRKNQANHDFDKYFAEDSTSDHLDADIVQQDIDRLEEIYEETKEFVNWRVAHSVQNEPTGIPTYDELVEWADEMEVIFKKYHILLHGGDLDRLLPHFSHDWKDIFRYPWIRDDEST